MSQTFLNGARPIVLNRKTGWVIVSSTMLTKEKVSFEYSTHRKNYPE
jgi:hypothetical protein